MKSSSNRTRVTPRCVEVPLSEPLHPKVSAPDNSATVRIPAHGATVRAWATVTNGGASEPGRYLHDPYRIGRITRWP